MSEQETFTPAAAPLPSTSWADAGTLLLALLPAVVAGSMASWYWLVLGALAWTLSLPVKFGVSALVSQALGAEGGDTPLRVGITVHAALLGLVSGAAELGVAAIVFLKAGGLGIDAPVATMFAFAVGAASAETLLVQAAGRLGMESNPEQVRRWADGARASLLIRNSLLFERLIAVAGHIGSRSLLTLSLLTASPWPACVAMIGFTLTDGLAGHGALRDWNFFAPATFRRFCGACALIVIGELTVLAFFLRG